MALYAIGEALIDFVPSRSGKPAADMHYTPAVGGAPLNVAAAYAKLGGKSYILSQVGDDAFGAQIAATAEAAGVDTRYLKRSRAAKTALAFVTLYDGGEREFAFYRDPSADMLYAPENLADITPQTGDILHYCSVSLVPGPMREAHRAAIAKFRAAGAAISFDINLRLPLWKNPTDLYAAVHEFLPLARHHQNLRRRTRLRHRRERPRTRHPATLPGARQIRRLYLRRKRRGHLRQKRRTRADGGLPRQRRGRHRRWRRLHRRPAGGKRFLRPCRTR